MTRKRLIAPTSQDLKRSAFRIYEKARRVAHWNPKTDIDFERPTTISAERQELAWHLASQSVYAEQVGMMQAARLLNEVDDIAIRYCLATAVSDEAKHSEVFTRYAMIRGGVVAPDSEFVNNLFEGLETIEDPFGRFIAHSMLEGLAADEFWILRAAFKGDVLEEIYRRVSEDEARHVAIGMDYMSTVLRDRAFEDHVHALEQYSHIALDIAGMTNDQIFVWLGGLVDKHPDEVARWMLRRHRQRIDHLLKGINKEAST
ncbi:MAG TPA: hypothetical protein VFZ66_06635 [Herpetosiphonaceae bacterium]